MNKKILIMTVASIMLIALIPFEISYANCVTKCEGNECTSECPSQVENTPPRVVERRPARGSRESNRRQARIPTIPRVSSSTYVINCSVNNFQCQFVSRQPAARGTSCFCMDFHGNQHYGYTF